MIHFISLVDDIIPRGEVGGFYAQSKSTQAAMGCRGECWVRMQQAGVKVKTNVCLKALGEMLENLQ